MDKEGIEFLKKEIVDLDELMEESADGKNSVIHLAEPKEIPEGYAGIDKGRIFSQKFTAISDEPPMHLLKEKPIGFFIDGEYYSLVDK
jgi:hypothetical protein